MATDQDRQAQCAQHIREEADGQRQYVLHPEDNDLFVRTGRQVIEGCRLGISLEVWFGECDAMFGRVLDWATGRAGQVRACYAVPRGTGIRLFFVPRTESYDFDLADELAELNGELVRSFNVGPVEIHQIPADEMDRFIAPRTAREVYSDASKPPEAVAS